jgi:hypothetical protein
MISMNKSIHSHCNFRIEISGWGLDNDFFAERTDLLWTADGEKRVQLHRALPEGAIVFIRLLASEPSRGSVPVAYQVQDVVAMDCNGKCQIRLRRAGILRAVATRGDPPMKPEPMNTTTHDRLATGEEVRSATSSTHDPVLEFCHAQGNYCQMDSDLGGIIRYPAEEFEFFAYLSEMDQSVAN